MRNSFKCSKKYKVAFSLMFASSSGDGQDVFAVSRYGRRFGSGGRVRRVGRGRGGLYLNSNCENTQFNNLS